MTKRDLRKPIMSDGDQWVDRNGMVLPLCVACELDTTEVSTQSSIVYGGFSLCLGHLGMVAELIRDGISTEQVALLLIR